MSEKNVHGSSQWTKSPAQKHNYDTSGSVAGLGGSIPASIYGGAAGVADIPPQPPDGLQSFGNIRFPVPAIHHAAAAHPPPTPSTVLMPLGAGGSNVPAPSGFVPPPFAASTAVGPTSAVTSVLTPNPFSVHSGSNVPFGLEQFPHLNPQQFEFTKIMTAMNTASVTMASVTASAANNAALSTSVISQQSGGRHHLDMATTSGAITSTIAENVLNAISVCSDPSVGTNSKANMGVKVPDDEKMRRIQHVVESGISNQSKQQIVQILDRISTLKPVEKLLLYLRMPGEAPETDPLRHPQNPLGTRSEINHTINWVRSHLEHDPQVSIPKQDVYNEYIAYCERLAIKPLSTADFGKVMKQVFPEIRPRRLGTRGHSRYCYAAMRKTTKLIPPELPHLGVNRPTQSNEETFQLPSGASSESDSDSWLIIKMWAESMLNIKVENMKGLAAHIKSNNLISASNTSNTQVTQKKFSQRDTKEKRLTGDLGPLKKRRKKKRKGSSSSESSCSQPLQPKLENINKMLSPADSNYTPSVSAPSEDEKKSIQLVEVKQEIMESPSFQRVQHLTSPKLQMASLTKNVSTDNKQAQLYQPPAHPAQHHVQQLMPMNLATEQRTVLARAPPSVNVMGPLGSIPSTSTAVKNLTPKIMDLSSAAAAVAPPAISELPIKEEVVDDYNPTNIFCKKVRKAQQTKGFWANSPTSIANGPVTTITIGEASPPMSVITTNAAITAAGTTAAVPEIDSHVSNYLMGPPAQITSTTSTSPSTSSLEGSATPKVASRNMMQLRAKKLRYVQSLINNANKAAAHANGPGDGSTELGDDKDVDLPENLGLPRERMISICNMDKHELDDYFLPGQEENSQEQEAELLQYFQTGDAEEKSNSLDAAKTNNPTATELPSHDKKLQDSIGANNYRIEGQSNFIKEFSTDPTQAVANDSGTTGITSGNSNNQNNAYVVAEAPPTTTTPAVGSASASLALMSQKHQQQQNKRKINLNAMTIGNINTVTTRKNCIFLPISPNINNTLSSNSVNTTNGGLFASPGLTKFRPKAALSKQQSLDCDSSNSDPMIGASRRRKSAYSISSASSTSASAPPSPSALQQQQQQLFGVQQSLTNQWQLTSAGAGYNEIPQNSSSLLTDQNSLDLDLFDAAGGNNFEQHTLALDATGECNLVPLSETQRSQSVPLSQLQRNHSPTFNRSFQTNFSTCTSVAQTPVPPEFNDFNIFSENSEPSIGNQNHSMKLQPAGVLSSDTAAILDEVDVNDILSSPEFVAKFSSVAQSNAATTTCSSAGSSSGYSSGACTTFGASNSMGGIVSRSVPSTPLPHHQQNPFGGSKFYGRRRAIDEIHLSPTAAGPASLFSGTKYGASQSSRAYDISKSMPTTPITTPCFRYSPAEFQRDFLINGNTLDSITSLTTINAMGNENFMSGAHVDINSLNNDSLIVEGTSTDAFATSTDADSIMVGSDILNNL